MDKKVFFKFKKAIQWDLEHWYIKNETGRRITILMDKKVFLEHL